MALARPSNQPPPASPMQQLRQHIARVVPLTEQEFAIVLARFSCLQLKKHHLLIQVGQQVKHNYFVAKGLLKLLYTDELGKQHFLSFAMEDWWETDFAAFYAATPATLSLECVEDTTVLCLSLTDYHALCDEVPQMARFFLHKASLNAIAAQGRLLSLLTTSVKERYEQLIRKYPALVQRLPKTVLASYLGVSREALSRLPV